MFFAGRIEARGEIRCKAIRAGREIEAGEGIKAGWGIEAGCGIKAGEDFGVYAGLAVHLSYKSRDAKITAKEKPANIICGEWQGEKEDRQCD